MPFFKNVAQCFGLRKRKGRRSKTKQTECATESSTADLPPLELPATELYVDLPPTVSKEDKSEPTARLSGYIQENQADMPKLPNSDEEFDMTSSIHWRKKGNSYYTSVNEGLAPTVGEERFKQAIQCYRKAFNLGKDEDEQLSAAKNIGMACWKLVNTLSEGTIHSSNIHVILYHVKEAFKYFSYAFIHGESFKSPKWIQDLLASTRTCWEVISSHILENFEMDTRCQVIYDIAMIVEIKIVKGEVLYKLAECQFHRGILAIQNSDYKQCLSAMRECYMPLNEVPRLCTDEQSATNVRVLEEDVLMHTCMAESMQARVVGDELFDKVLLDEESLNIDMVWEVIDWYKQATLRTRDITEVELEAIAVSRIGRVYHRVLKLKGKAKEYYKHAIELANSMFPRTFGTAEWYKDATQTLAKYQEETVQAEEERNNKEKQEILKELDKEVKQLDELKDKEHKEFLEFIYKTFPPKKEGQTLKLPEKTKDSDDCTMTSKMKKVLQQAVVHYHPDSVDAEKHGKKWKVLCEEITKYCTQRYETMKG